MNNKLIRKNNKKLKILLDIPLDDLIDIFLDNELDVSTVIEKLREEDRSDKNILKYSQKTNSVVVTIDTPFVSRLRDAGVKVVVLTLEDKAKIINEQLEKLILFNIDENYITDDEILDDFNKIKSGESSRMIVKSSN